MIIYKSHGIASRPCNARDLFLVSQGLQCGNCLVLVEEHIPDHLVGTNYHSPTQEILDLLDTSCLKPNDT